MDPTRTWPYSVDFVKAEIRTGQFFAMIGADRTFQNPQHCDPPMVKAQQIYLAMRGCLPTLKNVDTDDEHWIRVNLDKLRKGIDQGA